MAMTSSQADRLGCGRPASQLYDHLTSGVLDEHEQDCPYCQAALRDLAPLATAAAALAAEPVRPPAGLAGSVMSWVRREAGYGRLLPLPAPPPSRLAIAEHAAATLLSAAVGAVPGVTSRGCGFPVPGQAGRVSVAVSLRYGLGLAAAAAAIRAAVRAAARDQLGFTALIVDIVVEDIDPPA